MVQINFGEEINFEGIYSNLVEGKKPREPVSTKNVKSINFIIILQKIISPLQFTTKFSNFLTKIKRTAHLIQIFFSSWTQPARTS